MRRRCVVMANGRGRRMGDALSYPKCLLRIQGETLLERIVRLVRSADSGAELVVNAHDRRCSVPGAHLRLAAPPACEIDRFDPGLCGAEECWYLYGDTWYADGFMEHAFSEREGGALRFWGDERRVFAVRVRDAKILREEVGHLRRRELATGVACKGWQLLEEHALRVGADPAGLFSAVRDGTRDFNTLEEYRCFLAGFSGEGEML